METMHAAGRRNLPPVPRPSGERTAAVSAAPEPDEFESDSPTERFVVDLSTGGQHTVLATGTAGSDAAPRAEAGRVAVPPTPDATAPEGDVGQDAPARGDAELDAAQRFVARLRGAAADFAEAAGAESALVREAVPPARHRRARCRLVLRYADGSQVDVTFLGPAGLPGSPSRHGFDRQIRRWLKSGQRREDAWLVTDPDASDGLAVDLIAWIAAA